MLGSSQKRLNDPNPDPLECARLARPSEIFWLTSYIAEFAVESQTLITPASWRKPPERVVMLTAIGIRRGEMTMMSALCAKNLMAKSSSHHHVRVQIDLRPLSFEDREPPRAPWNT